MNIGWRLLLMRMAALAVLAALAPGCALSRAVAWQARETARANFTAAGRLQRAADVASSRFSAGEWAEAERLYAQLVERRPAFELFRVRRGIALLRLGRDAEGWAELEAAVHQGYPDAAELDAEPALEPYRDDARLSAIAERARENDRQLSRSVHAALEEAPGQEPASFPTVERLLRAYWVRERDLDREVEALRIDWPSSQVPRARLRAEQLAALARHAERKPSQREQALIESLRLRVQIESPLSERWNRGRSERLAADSATFLRDFPASADANEVRTIRVMAIARGVLDDGAESLASSAPLRCEEALPELASLSALGPVDPWGRAASILEAQCRHAADPGDRRVREAVAAVLQRDDHPAASLFEWRTRTDARILALRLDGPPPFEVTTLDGRTVSPATFRGKLLLLDFWSPG